MVYTKSTDSTNTAIKELIINKKIETGYSLYTFNQLKGRARGERAFESNDGGLYYSIALNAKDKDITSLPVYVSLIISNALDDFFSINTTIKWVNDIIYKSKKCAGILCEKVYDYVIIGIGVNVFNTFSKELENKAISIKKDKRIDYTLLHRLAEKIDNELKTKLNGFNFPLNWIEDYKKKSAILGKQCTLSTLFGEKIAEGAVINFETDGKIIIKTPKGLEVFDIGEISLVSNFLYN